MYPLLIRWNEFSWCCAWCVIFGRILHFQLECLFLRFNYKQHFPSEYTAAAAALPSNCSPLVSTSFRLSTDFRWMYVSVFRSFPPKTFTLNWLLWLGQNLHGHSSNQSALQIHTDRDLKWNESEKRNKKRCLNVVPSLRHCRCTAQQSLMYVKARVFDSFLATINAARIWTLNQLTATWNEYISFGVLGKRTILIFIQILSCLHVQLVRPFLPNDSALEP